MPVRLDSKGQSEEPTDEAETKAHAPKERARAPPDLPEQNEVLQDEPETTEGALSAYAELAQEKQQGLRRAQQWVSEP